jgi:Rrf2 family protein
VPHLIHLPLKADTRKPIRNKIVLPIDHPMLSQPLDFKQENYVLLEMPSKVEYAILALLEMARQSNPKTPITVGEITTKHAIPDRYLEQILGTLRRGGLLKSQRGARGGYTLARHPKEITLLEIVALIEGDQQAVNEVDPQTVEMKLIRDSWQQANLAAQSILERSTLFDLCQKADSYLQASLMYYI